MVSGKVMQLQWRRGKEVVGVASTCTSLAPLFFRFFFKQQQSSKILLQHCRWRHSFFIQHFFPPSLNIHSSIIPSTHHHPSRINPILHLSYFINPSSIHHPFSTHPSIFFSSSTHHTFIHLSIHSFIYSFIIIHCMFVGNKKWYKLDFYNFD